MGTYANALLNSHSRKEVFTYWDLRSHIYAWESEGADVWSVTIEQVVVIGVNLDDSAMVEASSVSALTSGQFFWDGTTEKLYTKVAASADPFGGFYVGTLRFRFNTDGEELSNEPYEARVAGVPALTTKTGETFDGKLGQTNAGGVALHNADALLNRSDIEPDGEVTVIARLKTFGGV